MTDGANQARAPKGRSPSYPGVSLDVAVQKAERLFEAQRDHMSDPRVVLGHMGYSPKSGAGLVTLAALKKFGLLKDEGVGKARRAGLSEVALRIVRDKRVGSPERIEALKGAALTPPIHREVWERYHGRLPDDDALMFYLEMERTFTPSGAKEFVGQFRKTIAYAQLAPSDTVADTDGHIPEDDPGENRANQGQSGQSGRSAHVTPGTMEVQIPLPSKPWAKIQLPESMTEEAWDHMLRFFEFMKPSLVRESEEDDSHTGDQG